MFECKKKSCCANGMKFSQTFFTKKAVKIEMTVALAYIFFLFAKKIQKGKRFYVRDINGKVVFIVYRNEKG